MACTPGGSFMTFTLIRTPLAVGVSVAVPTLSPLPFTKLACAFVVFVCANAGAALSNTPISNMLRNDMAFSSACCCSVIPAHAREKQSRALPANTQPRLPGGSPASATPAISLLELLTCCRRPSRPAAKAAIRREWSSLAIGLGRREGFPRHHSEPTATLLRNQSLLS